MSLLLPPTLGRGELCGCLWQTYVDIWGSHFYPGFLPLPTLCPGKTDGFHPFHCVFLCSCPSLKAPSIILLNVPSSALGNLFSSPGTASLALHSQAFPQTLLFCFCTSILSIFLWGLGFWTNQRKCLVFLFRHHHLFPEAIRTQLKASGWC